MEHRKVLTIFIGSPGDLQEERREAREVVERINKHLGKNLNVYVDLRGWEDTLPGFSRPQERINEDIKSSDLFLGLLWKRWGSPTGQFSSGFEEEFEIAQNLKEKGQVKDIWLFFKEIPSDNLMDPGIQLQKVIIFKKRIEAERKLLFKTFQKTDEWSKIFSDYLSDYLTKEIMSLHEAPEVSKTPKSVAQSSGVPIAVGETVNNGEIEVLLSTVLSTVSSDKNLDSLESYSKVRLFLLSKSLLDESISSDEFFGTHEIQFLYTNRERVVLLPRERKIILRTLISDDDDVKVGWYWFEGLGIDVEKFLLMLLGYDQSEQVRIQSLKYYKEISKVLDFSIIEGCLSDSSEEVKTEAIQAFENYGSNTHIPILEKILEQEPSDMTKAAWVAIFAILAREKPDEAINFIVNTPEEKRGWCEKYLDHLLSAASKEKTRLLLNDSNNFIRSSAFNCLRDSLSEAELRTFTNDKSFSLVGDAYLELISRNIEVDLSEIRQKFYSSSEDSMISRALLLALSKNELDKIKIEILKKKSQDELLKAINWINIDSHLSYQALLENYFDEYKSTLKKDILDSFERIKQDTLNLLTDLRKLSDNQAKQFFEMIEENEQFIKCQFFNSSMCVLSRKAESSDIKIARFIIEKSFPYFENEIHLSTLKIFQKFGVTKDSTLLVKLSSVSEHKMVRIEAARLALELDKKNDHNTYESLIKSDKPETVKLILNHTSNGFKHQKLEYSKELLHNSDSEMRLIALAYLFSNLDKKQLINLLEDYIQSETYYYNVVCWIDRYLYSPQTLRELYRNKIRSYLN